MNKDEIAAPARRNAPETSGSPLDVMNFLNEISSHYPKAISFASGRPSEDFFDLNSWIALIPEYVKHFSEKNGIDLHASFNLLAQYGRTNGIINDLIANQIRTDEGISCHADQIVVTGGCQEALDLIVTNLCPDPDDAILVVSPCYIGITGVACLKGIELAPFYYGEIANFLPALRQATAESRSRGKSPRILYLVPDFDNPTGAVLPRAIREEIVEFCGANGIAILEDNPYGMFRYEGDREPTMYSLDRLRCVIYLGTFSKTICPSLRVGFMVVPESLFGSADASKDLLGKLSQSKSFGSLNTSQLTQAVVGALLLQENCSLARLVAPARDLYRGNRDLMLAQLSRGFAGLEEQVQWNSPEGGFFLIVTLPFAFGHREAEICASDYGILVMPLSFFAFDDKQDKKVRLAFSNITHSNIVEGVARFADFVRNFPKNHAIS